MNDRKIFLLGGHDLEMITIAGILQKQGVEFYDKNLSWDSALLSRYSSELEQYGGQEGITIYGVELRDDLSKSPKNYVQIDHHNENSDRPSSLEQVMKILNLPLEDRRLRLIAANDSRYIPGMISAGATQEEIDSIRLEDRQAQGVTGEQEAAAEEAIKKNCEEYLDIKIVSNAPSGAFSAVCDRISHYKKLIVYNSYELCYYGRGAKKIFNQIPAELKSYSYYGGGDDGYFGIDLKASGLPDSSLIIINMADKIKNSCTPYSYHIFYFPFKWDFDADKEELFSERFDIKRLDNKEIKNSQWQHVQISRKSDKAPSTFEQENDAKDLFDERQYYFEFVHPVLYDFQDDDSPIIRHYERLEPRNKDVYYDIEIKDKSYRLKVDAINMNLYSTGVGMLIFYLRNEDAGQSDENSVRDINQFGRRIMPPFCGEFNADARSQLAKKLKITGLESVDVGRYEDVFDYAIIPSGEQMGPDNVWKPSRIMTNLVNDIFPAMAIRSVVDDRMLVNCWYGNDEYSGKVKDINHNGSDNNELPSDFKEFWYKYVFIDDGNDSTCQNDVMRDTLINKHTYFRWQKYGTLYGISRYSIVALTDTSWFSTNILARHMRTIYARLFELLIIQRASVLRFSGEVTDVSSLHKEEKLMAERISSLYKEYIRFVNQIYFRNVTIQDQGIELYSMLSESFNTEKQIKGLDGEIDELNQYITLQIDSRRNRNGEKLNILAAYFLPPTLLAGLLGMNIFEDWGCFGILVLIIIALSVLLVCVIKNWLNK